MEQWNNGMMEYWDHWCSIWLKNNHDSNIPSFHVGGTKPVSLKAA